MRAFADLRDVGGSPDSCDARHDRMLGTSADTFATTARERETAHVMKLEHHHHHHTTGHGAEAAYQKAYQEAQPDAGRRVIEVELEARECDWNYAPGKSVRGWGFNGQIPGPTIEAEVGDVVQVRLTNHLSEPTNIHWHGLRIPAPMDGTENVQRPVQPGETFVYRFRVPDAGTFWYHPHINETVQLEMGLYGAFIVRGPGEPRLDAERILVLDDLRLDKTGEIARFGGMIERHDGREGDIRLVNGAAEPQITMAAGQIERWRVLNASSARYILFSLGGLPFRVIGTDGGLLEAPVTVTEVLVPTADRVDLAVGPFQEGQEIPVEARKYFRMTVRKRDTERFATLRVGGAKPSHADVPERLRSIPQLAPPDAAPTRTVKLGFKMSLTRGVDFVINKERHHQADPVKIGELQVWDVVNTTMMDHPFHLHGFFFQVLSVDGEAPPWRSWEDVVNVPPRGTVRIAWLPDERPGSWMYHCHILEHHESGMMAHFDVVP
jgi:FtsP/CotA-like multicopper oxidase with cupredoxin domain